MTEYNAYDLNVAFDADGNLWNGERLESHWTFEAKEGDVFDILGVGKFTVVEAELFKNIANYQGNDSYDTWIVIKSEDGRHFKKDGYYSSWDGGDLDGAWSEVEKVEKTILVWEKK